ncbi:MAG: glycosyltransferase [Thermoplasmata archaeon]|nr:glycosyltransferase [Thermoplasmata archaeon]
MKILHVHNIAHIPPLVVQELEKVGVEADFVEDVRTVDLRSYDIVHGHYAVNRATIRAFNRARKLDIPFVLHCHGSDLRLVSPQGRKKLGGFYLAISRHLRKGASHIFLSTPDLIEYEPKGEYVPNPVDLEAFRPLPDEDKADRDLICGRFLKGSKIYDFIEPDKKYDCISQHCEIKFPPNVQMLPEIPHDRLPNFFNRYSFMLGTMCDLISMARMEAMACGLKTFTNFERSFVSYYGGENPDEADNPRDFVMRHHNPGICVKRFIEVYEELLKK